MLLLTALLSVSPMYAEEDGYFYAPREEKLYLATDRPYYFIGDKIYFSGFLLDPFSLSPKLLSNFIYVELIDKENEVVSRVKIKRDSLMFHNSLMLPPDMEPGPFRIRGYTMHMLNYDKDYLFCRNVMVYDRQKPDTAAEIQVTDGKKGKKDYDVSFFPESGRLMPGLQQIVAFKAVGEDGLGVDVNLKIYDSEGKKISETISMHRGMGKFSMKAKAGEVYRVVAFDKDGFEKDFKFSCNDPAPAAIQHVLDKDRLLFRVFMGNEVNLDSLSFVFRCRGEILYAASVDKPFMVFELDSGSLPAGVASVAVIDERLGVPMAERLFFVRNRTETTLEMTSDKALYGAREKVSMKFRMTASAGKPVPGILSVSVTDKSSVCIDSSRCGILPYLLLTSDLKGYVEDPGHYFRSSRGFMELDLLMLTQGWKTYDYHRSGPEVSSHGYPYENSQFISGEVKGFWGNDVKSPQLVIFQPDLKLFQIVQLEGTNRFVIGELDFPDSTVFLLQALSRKGKGATTELAIDPEVFAPETDSDRWNFTVPFPATDSSFSFPYADNGLNYNIQAARIVSRRVEEDKPFSLNSKSMSESRLDKLAGMDIVTVLSMFPGVMRQGNAMSVRGGAPIAFYVDKVPLELSDIENIPVSDIRRIDLISGPEAAIFGIGGAGGVFSIMTKEGHYEGVERLPLLSIANVSHLGWKRPDKFYQPAYEVPEVLRSAVPDYRNTIAWEPALYCDSSGVACMQFYTADRNSDYRVVVEGISSDGNIVCAEGNIGIE